MSDLADRHASTADGAIRTTADATLQPVVVHLPPALAARRDVQHTAAMLINLLARCKDFVSGVNLQCPDVEALEGVIPAGVSRAPTLAGALLALAASVGPDAVPVTASPDTNTVGHQDSFTIVLGPGDQAMGAWRVHGNRWHGTATRHGIADAPDCGLPFGPYIAACLAVAAVCDDLAGRGFAAVEAYPERGAPEDATSAATPEFWLAAEFAMAVEDDRFPVMRREL